MTMVDFFSGSDELRKRPLNVYKGKDPLIAGDDQFSLAETASTGSSVIDDDLDVPNSPLHRPCDACPCCSDRCGNKNCSTCTSKRISLQTGQSAGVQSQPQFNAVELLLTLCEIRRHNSETSCWIVAGDNVYDATHYLSRHPGGAESILKKAGGAQDCKMDLQFHSRVGRDMWKKYKIGKVISCSDSAKNKPWWMFWSQ